MAKMQAAVVEKFSEPLVLREWDIPVPGTGEILVKVEACGVCHTDIHAASGDWPVKPMLPFIPGHEGIGHVTAVGAGVTVVREGDRVGVPWLHSACGHCEYCLTAWETICPSQTFTGYTANGAFAEYLLADPNYVAHIPPGLPSSEAAPIICAGVKGGDVAAAVKKATDGGAHGVLITAPSLAAFKQGVGMTRKHGTCVLVGLPPGDFPVPLFDVVANCISIRGSFVGNRQDLAESLSFAAEGKVKADIELQPLTDINDVFQRMQHGDVAARVVLDLTLTEARSALPRSQKPLIKGISL